MLPDTHLDSILPSYDFHEVHQIVINAQPEKVYASVKAVTAMEISVFKTLMIIRHFFSKEMYKFKPDIPLLEEICNKGFTVLDDNTNYEVVFGVIGQFWKTTYGKEIEVKNKNDFINFSKPDFLKAAANMHVKSTNGKTLLTTETRIVATSKEAKRKFRGYWIIIRLGSGFIRRMWLRAIKRRAEIMTLRGLSSE
jgi:hypothetical protein